MTTNVLPNTKPFEAAARIAVVWFGVVLVAAAAGAFHTPGDGPPIGIGLAVIVPPAIVLWRAGTSHRFREWARSLDLRVLTMLQTWRVGGLAFLALATVGALPDGFALSAGLGDVAVGLTAPLVALFVVGRVRKWRRIYMAWTVFGVVDLVNAVTLGVLYSASVAGVLASGVSTDLMEQLPMILIPAFGVPATLVLHIISLVNVTGAGGVAARVDHGQRVTVLSVSPEL